MLKYIFALTDWFKVAVLLRRKNVKALFNEGEIWWCSIGMNVGVEIYGKGRNFERPVLILKKFDGDSFFGIPITSRIKQGDWYAPIHFSGKHVTAVLNQARMLDAVRLHELMGTLPENHFRDIQQSFIRIFDILENTEPANEAGSEDSIRPQ